MCDCHLKAFSAELLSKQPEIDKVLEKGEQILEEAHPDAVPILQNMIQALQDGWKELKKMTSDRSEELATALLELQGVEEMLVQLWEWVEDARKKLATKQTELIGETLEEVETQLAEHEVTTSINPTCSYIFRLSTNNMYISVVYSLFKMM